LLPKSNFAKALNYYYSLAPYPSNYLENADARLDNNVAERGIRPLTIGRKNWLFVGSEDGGKANATILSLVQTCRNLGINPQSNLRTSCGASWDTPPGRSANSFPTTGLPPGRLPND